MAKQRDCGLVKKWIPSIRNQLYWTAYSTKTGAEKVAKWKSVINHIHVFIQMYILETTDSGSGLVSHFIHFVSLTFDINYRQKEIVNL